MKLYCTTVDFRCFRYVTNYCLFTCCRFTGIAGIDLNLLCVFVYFQIYFANEDLVRDYCCIPQISGTSVAVDAFRYVYVVST